MSNDSWDGVEPILAEISNQTGYRVLLTEKDGRSIADSGDQESGAVPADTSQARTVIDPDAIDHLLVGAKADLLSWPGACDGCHAPAAYLFLSPLPATATATFDLGSLGVQVALIMGGVLAVAAVLSLLTGAKLTRPLRTLTASATRMMGGDYGARVAVRGGDEIARLSTAFNSMSAAREQQDLDRKALISDIAHELRTPLSNIRGHIEAAKDHILPFDEELLRSLNDDSAILQQLVEDLQPLALSDAGALRLDLQDIELRELVAQSLASVSTATTAGIHLENDCPGG